MFVLTLTLSITPAYAQAQKMLLGGTGIMRRDSETDGVILRQSQVNDDDDQGMPMHCYL